MLGKDKIDAKKFFIDGDEYILGGIYLFKRVDEYDPFDWEDAWTTYYTSKRIESKNKHSGMIVLRNAFRSLIDFITLYSPYHFSYSTDGDSCWESLFTRFSKIIENKYGYTCYRGDNGSFHFYKHPKFDN